LIGDQSNVEFRLDALRVRACGEEIADTERNQRKKYQEWARARHVLFSFQQIAVMVAVNVSLLPIGLNMCQWAAAKRSGFSSD